MPTCCKRENHSIYTDKYCYLVRVRKLIGGSSDGLLWESNWEGDRRHAEEYHWVEKMEMMTSMNCNAFCLHFHLRHTCDKANPLGIRSHCSIPKCCNEQNYCGSHTNATTEHTDQGHLGRKGVQDTNRQFYLTTFVTLTSHEGRNVGVKHVEGRLCNVRQVWENWTCHWEFMIMWQ